MDGYKVIDKYKITKEDEEALIIRDSYDGDVDFDDGMALAVLLIKEVIFLNNNWWEKNWPKEARDGVSMNVNCSDVFAWGCSDAENLKYSEIEDLYDHYQKDNSWGPTIWCIKKRKVLPQQPIYEAIKKIGDWDLSEMGLEDGFDGSIEKMEGNIKK